MINLSVSLTEPSTVPAASSSNASTPGIGSQSFDSELSAAISQALSEMGIDPSTVQLSVSATPSQTSAASQNSAAATTASWAPVTSAPSQSTTATSDTDPDDAYWASQPAAVQQLRNIPDETQRAALAMQLASEGYTIDYPIMVEGWDPQIATQIRQAAGYTWVPSALQSPVPVAPGLTFPGLTTYNPNDPPPGSILVS